MAVIFFNDFFQIRDRFGAARFRRGPGGGNAAEPAGPATAVGGDVRQDGEAHDQDRARYRCSRETERGI